MIQLSIIVPTYNRSTLLIPTLQSLINQTASSYEIIIVDDGSTDDTESVVNELIRNSHSAKVKYYKVSNRERGAARNFGAAKAEGDYVNFFDSDDIAYPHHVDLFQKTALTNEYPEVFAVSYDIKKLDGKMLKSMTLNQDVSEFISKGNHLSCNGVFIKKEVAIANPFSEHRLLSGFEDYELWLRLSSKFNFPCFLEISHAVIQHDERSTLNFNPETLIKSTLLMLELAFNEESVMKQFATSKNVIESSAFSYIALHIALTGKSKSESVKWFLKSITASPSSLFTRRTLGIFKHLLLS